MNVLAEILEWSPGRPMWQRDALRRLVLHGELSDEDINSLTEICKSKHGLAEQQAANPLTAEHIPNKVAGAAPVLLKSIHHQQGVNALAENQTLKFGSGLTVVYGDNGAGKTGYIRILKNACRARGQESILGNVVSGTSSPTTPVFNIKYQVGTESEPREWTETGGDEFVSRVSVFDAQCATVYLTEKTNVAFRPFGLDMFDKLVKACKAVREKLEGEQRALDLNALAVVRENISEGTVVAKFLTNISSLTKSDDVHKLANLSAEEESQFAFLTKSLRDLQVNDPEKLIAQLTLYANRLRDLVQHLKHVENSLSVDAVEAVFSLRTEVHLKADEAKRLRETAFPEGMLDGTGSELWQALWESARQFSQESAYPGEAFPVVEDAHCVLCQQELGQAAAEQLKQFETFVTSTMEREFQRIKEKYDRLCKTFTDIKTMTEAVEETLKEIRIGHAPVADAIATSLATNESRRAAVLVALADDQNPGTNIPALASAVHETETLVKEVEERIKALRTNDGGEKHKHMTAEAKELQARKMLATHRQTVLNDIERQKKYAAYGSCIEETRTHTITQKSTAVTKTAVSQRLKQSFSDELDKLSFKQVNVELKESGGERGVFYHKIVLTRAPDVELPKVVSEGEQRCLSIAAFFAELSTADDLSGIVFDDPVSSLDFQWRDAVAQRLVQEAKARQVIVFTHDIVFLLRLKEFAENENVEQSDQYVCSILNSSGVCSEELPWIALPVSKKIGYLKNGWQAVDKLSRDGHPDAYEEKAKYLYGRLREAWERTIEEVLFNGVVERYRSGIETKRIAHIADINEVDCKTVEKAMTKCSPWTGHDQAPAARAPIPDPAELKSDIETLENWVAAIRRRRRNATGR